MLNDLIDCVYHAIKSDNTLIKMNIDRLSFKIVCY